MNIPEATALRAVFTMLNHFLEPALLVHMHLRVRVYYRSRKEEQQFSYVLFLQTRWKIETHPNGASTDSFDLFSHT